MAGMAQMQLWNLMQHNTVDSENEIFLPSLDSGFLNADFIVNMPGHGIWNQQLLAHRARISHTSHGSDLSHIMALGKH